MARLAHAELVPLDGRARRPSTGQSIDVRVGFGDGRSLDATYFARDLETKEKKAKNLKSVLEVSPNESSGRPRLAYS